MTIQEILQLEIEDASPHFVDITGGDMPPVSEFCFLTFAFLQINRSTFDHGFSRWIFRCNQVLQQPPLIWIQRKSSPLLN